jgi:uncharacterized protein (TIGR03067 family)
MEFSRALKRRFAMKVQIITLGAIGLLLGGIGLLVASDDPKSDVVRKEREIYQGTWRVTALEADGSKLSEDDCARVTVHNQADGGWTVRLEGFVIWQGTSTIDPTKTPKWIDFSPTEGTDAGKNFLGIYEFGKDTRKLCYAEAGKERPRDFLAKSGSGHVLITFKRERPIAFLTEP